VAKRAPKVRRAGSRATDERRIVTDLPPELVILDGEAKLVFQMLEHRIHDMFRGESE